MFTLKETSSTADPPDYQQQEAVELLLDAEMNRLNVEIERKDHEIREKDRALNDLRERQAELDEQLTQSQQNDEHNVSLINLLHKSRNGLAKQLKLGQDELQSMKEDKQTYKDTLDFIVTKDSRVKKSFLKKVTTLQRKINTEQVKFLALEHTLERKCREYEDRIELVTEENRNLEQTNALLREAAVDTNALHDQRVAELTTQLMHLREELEQAHKAKDEQKAQFEETQQTYQAQHNATVARLAEKVDGLKEKIRQLEETLPSASALPPMVSTKIYFVNSFCLNEFTRTVFPNKMRGSLLENSTMHVGSVDRSNFQNIKCYYTFLMS